MNRRAFTLIEMLVALAITLIMMGAVVTLFQVMTDSVSGSRSLIEMSDRLRACRNRIQADLIGATATMKPPLQPASDEGYLEIIEGPNTDANYSSLSPPSIQGDADDAIMFTVRSRGEPFVGKFNSNSTIESQVAEVVYFTVADGPLLDAVAGTRLSTLYRRVMLVSQMTAGNLGSAANSTFYNLYDVSARYQNTVRVPNTLGDLTKPENRFMHVGQTAGAFPFRVTPGSLVGFDATTGRQGDDVLMTNVLAFDVQVFDPGAPVFISNQISIEPRDAIYQSLLAGAPSAFGAYADLGYAQTYSASGSNPIPLFNGKPAAKSGWVSPMPFTYDTWSLHYESDGVPQMGVVADAGTNGLDDDNNGVVDDIGEFDTLPPYSAQLRGLRIIVRAYDPSSQQVREITVVQDFLPE